MYITTLLVEHLKLIAKLTLQFNRDGVGPAWTVILGENGLCKTSLLQAIALVASGETRGNQLADVPGLRDLRGNDPLALGAMFSDIGSAIDGLIDGGSPDRGSSLLLQTVGSSELIGDGRLVDNLGMTMDIHGSISKESDRTRADSIPEMIADLSDSGSWIRRARAQNLPGLLVVGYGVSRILRPAGTTAPPSDPARDRLGPLFSPKAPIGIDFVDHLRVVDPALAEAYSQALDEALLGVQGLMPRIKGFERRGGKEGHTAERTLQSHRFSFSVGSSNVGVPATWLSQGYQATIAWIADLIGWAFWEEKKAVKTTDIRGIVLIDELDLHIHPTWQLTLVPALKRLFPRVQFIVTTHSPMLLPGLSAGEIVRLGLDDEGNVIQLPQAEDPRLMTGSQIFRTYFGVENAHPSDLGSVLMRYSALAGDPGRSEAEDAEVKQLREALIASDADPGWEPVAIDAALREPEP